MPCPAASSRPSTSVPAPSYPAEAPPACYTFKQPLKASWHPPASTLHHQRAVKHISHQTPTPTIRFKRSATQRGSHGRHRRCKVECEFKKLSKNMGDKLDKDKGRYVLLSTPFPPSTLISSFSAIEYLRLWTSNGTFPPTWFVNVS
jgi:hypothetical protein